MKSIKPYFFALILITTFKSVAQVKTVDFHQSIITTGFDKLFAKYGNAKALELIRFHFVEEINYHRALFKNKALKMNDSLNLAAQQHSEDMANRNYFSHINPDSLDPGDRVEKHHYMFSICKENISFNILTIKEIIDAYYRSKTGHKDIIIDPRMREVGFGLAYSKSKKIPGLITFYATADYGIR
jgi:uncharacterized protein YkwD